MPPALAVLLKAPVAGRVKTRLAAGIGAGPAVAVYRQLAERQLRAVPAHWAVTIHFDPPEAEAEMRQWLGQIRLPAPDFRPQSPGDLGARLSAAFDHHFQLGAAVTIAIGGDCPALDEPRLRAAAARLATAEVVIGPAVDGGYYLIGLRSPHPALFAGISWGGAGVLTETRARLRATALPSEELPPLGDVDDEASWREAVEAGLLPPGAMRPPL